MSDIIEDRTMLIIYAIGIIFFIMRVVGMMNGTWEEITSQPEFQKSIATVQPLLELIITVSFIMAVIPRWLGKLRHTEPVKLLTMACSIGGVMLLVYMIPEFTEASYGEQKLVFTLIIGVSLITVHVISYWYGKKYKSDKKEDGVEENEDDD